jgi:deoxyribonuclease V
VDDFGDIETIAGIDVRIRAKQPEAICAIVLFSYPEGQILEKVSVRSEIKYPYIPGLLTFREGPLVLKCFSRLSIRPDIVFFDGQGYAHPRRMGLASHMGILLDVPSVGVAKSRLIGEYEMPGRKKGDFSILIDNEEIIGVALRSRKDTKPIFLSIGHRICLVTAIGLVLQTCKTRIPEPTKEAHNYLKSLDR